eukprot:5527387-Pleurochrysis_carterae.AAC.2
MPFFECLANSPDDVKFKCKSRSGTCERKETTALGNRAGSAAAKAPIKGSTTTKNTATNLANFAKQRVSTSEDNNQDRCRAKLFACFAKCDLPRHDIATDDSQLCCMLVSAQDEADDRVCMPPRMPAAC